MVGEDHLQCLLMRLPQKEYSRPNLEISLYLTGTCATNQKEALRIRTCRAASDYGAKCGRNIDVIILSSMVAAKSKIC